MLSLHSVVLQNEAYQNLQSGYEVHLKTTQSPGCWLATSEPSEEASKPCPGLPTI